MTLAYLWASEMIGGYRMKKGFGARIAAGSADQEVFQGASEDCVSSKTWVRDFEG